MTTFSSTLEDTRIPTVTTEKSVDSHRNYRASSNKASDPGSLIAATLLSTAVVFCFQPTSEAFPADTSVIAIPSGSAGQLIGQNRNDLKVLGRIRQLATYKDGWAGPDSLSASSKAIKDAEDFVKALDFQSLYIPYVSLSQDGEINFWWNLPDIRFDLGIYGDGTYVYYAKAGEIETAQDSIPISTPLPSEIMARLKKS